MFEHDEQAITHFRGHEGTTSGHSSWRDQGDDLGPPHPSTHLPWVVHAVSRCAPIRYGRIASISATHDATKFVGPINPICASTKSKLVHSGTTDVGFNRHRRGLPPSELQIYDPHHTPSFSSSILHFPLIAPPGLKLCQHGDHFT
jgi:hypothetical protein